MNYIAHLHIAEQTNTSLIGNFLGDFVKGSDLSMLPPAIQTGIKLHRKVDVYTDSHEAVRELKLAFVKPIQRMSGVALDIYFDHLLMQHWQRFSATPAEDLFSQFYHQLTSHSVEHSQRFSAVRQGLLEYRWLNDYRFDQSCLRAFQSIENRLGGKIRFAHEAMRHLQKNQKEIEQGFLHFYPQLLDYSGKIACSSHMTHLPTK